MQSAYFAYPMQSYNNKRTPMIVSASVCSFLLRSRREMPAPVQRFHFSIRFWNALNRNVTAITTMPMTSSPVIVRV